MVNQEGVVRADLVAWRNRICEHHQLAHGNCIVRAHADFDKVKPGEILYEGPGSGNSGEQLKVLTNLRQHFGSCWANLKQSLFHNLAQRADCAVATLARGTTQHLVPDAPASGATHQQRLRCPPRLAEAQGCVDAQGDAGAAPEVHQVEGHILIQVSPPLLLSVSLRVDIEICIGHIGMDRWWLLA